MKILTANRLGDGIAVWYADGGWAETVDQADLAHDKAAEDRLELQRDRERMAAARQARMAMYRGAFE